MQQDEHAGGAGDERTADRVNEIDLLRFLAALAVLLFHYSFRGYFADDRTTMPYLGLAPIGKYGYLGVDLFFIISGFVILMTASRGGLREFVVSRIARLYPAYWVCCSITFLAILTIGGARYDATISQYLTNMTMLGGFFHVPYIDGSYWSLTVELKFYAMVGVVLLVGALARVQALLCGWLVAAIALRFWPVDSLGYWLIVDYAAYFIAGATCFLIWSRGVSVARAAMLIASWALALANAIEYSQEVADYYSTPISEVVVGAIVSIYFLVMLLVSLRRTGIFARKRWLTLGALTYPLYLLHQKIGFMIFNLGYPKISAHLLFWGTLGAMLVASYLVYAQVERRVAPWLRDALNRAVAAVRAGFSRSAVRTRA